MLPALLGKGWGLAEYDSAEGAEMWAARGGGSWTTDKYNTPWVQLRCKQLWAGAGRNGHV